MDSDYRFELMPKVGPNELARLRTAVGWGAAQDLISKTLGKTHLWAACFSDQQLVGYIDAVSDGVADA